MHAKSRVLGQPGKHLGVLVGRIVVDDEVQFLLLGRLAIDRLEEPQPLLMPMELIGHRPYRAGEYVQCGEQCRHAIALAIVRHRRTPSALERQSRLRAVQCLDLRLLIAAQHQRVLGRIEVQTDDVLELVDEAWVVGELERLDPGLSP